MDDADHPLITPLTKIFALLRSSSALDLAAGRTKLEELIDEEGDILLHRAHRANAQSKALPRFLEEQVKQLFARPETHRGAVIAAEQLMSVEFADITVRTVLLSSCLSKAVIDCTEASPDAARVWGVLMANGCGLIGDIIESQTRQSLEWLQSEAASPKRYAASLFLREVGTRSPSTLSTRLAEVLKGSWCALRDASEATRVVAAQALELSISIALQQGKATELAEAMDTFLKTAVQSMQLKQAEVVHGAVLGFNAFLKAFAGWRDEAVAAATFPINRKLVSDGWTFIITTLSKPSRGPQLTIELINAIPLMARFDSVAFARDCINDALSASVAVLRSNPTNDEKTQMFLAIGQLGAVIPDKVAVYIERIVRAIEGNLVTNKRAKKERCPAAVSCLAMLAKANRFCVRPYVLPLLDALFATTLTVEFAKDLTQLTTALPELHSMCMDRVIGLISSELENMPNRIGASPADNEGCAGLLGALDALSNINFRGYSVLSFIDKHLTRFFTDPHPAVRRASASLAARLMLSGCTGPSSPCRKERGVMIHCGCAHIQLVLRVQTQLIAVAVADADSDIRLSTLELLAEEFDQTLALQDCIRSLVPALNDKHANRQAAVRLLGRLSRRNAGCVLPVLRKVMVQCTTELEHFNSDKKQEHATSILGTLIEAAPVLIRPYTQSLMSLCVVRLSDDHVAPNVLTALLSCVGKLVQHVSGPELEAARRLKGLIVRHITDSSSTQEKQEAIRALGSIIRATTDVNVYDQFPQLLPSLLSTLHGGFKEAWPVRKDVLTLMGIIGAVDPVKVKSLSRNLELEKGADANDPIAISRTRGDDVMAHIVVAAILDVLQMVSTESSDERCSSAVSALVEIFSSRTMKLSTVVAYMPRVIPELLRHIRSQARMRERLFREMTTLVSVVKYHIRGNLDEIFDVVKHFIRGDNTSVLAQVVALVIELRLALNEEFKPYLPSVLPLLVQAVSQDTSSDKATVQIVFSCFEQFGTLMEGQLHVVLPCVVDIVSSAFLPQATRIRAVNTILIFAKQLSTIDEHAARCTHCLCRVLSEELVAVGTKPAAGNVGGGGGGGAGAATAAQLPPLNPLHHECLSAILALVQNLGAAFEKYVPMVRQVVQARFGAQSNLYATFASTVEHALTAGKRHIVEPIRRLPPPARAAPTDEALRAQAKQDPDRFKTLRAMLTTIDRSTEEEWKSWLRQLSVELMKASSSSALRVSVLLAQVYDPFARQLFHPAFASCYAEMDDATRSLVVSQLGSALRSKRLPSEVLQELLNLAEYMERTEDIGGGSSGGQGGAGGKDGGGNARSPQRSGTASAGGGSASAAAVVGGLFDIRTLTERSERCNLHAKAIHYLEAQFYELTRDFERGMMLGRTTRLAPAAWKELLNVCEKCIALNNVLGQNETANGILTYIQKHFSRLTGERHFTVTDAELYGKLGWWSESYRAYHSRYKTDPENPANVVGLMRSMEALGDLSRMLDLWRVHHRKTVSGKRDMQLISSYVAKAAWLLQRWDDLKVATDHMSIEGYSGTTAVFYQAVQRTHERRIDEAVELIERCRRALDKDLSALVAESYDRAYALIVGLQQLAELEEIMMLVSSNPSGAAAAPVTTSATPTAAATPVRQGETAASAERLRVLWERRLLSMAQDPEDWQGTLANHSLALRPEEELSMWVRFVTLCRNQGRERMSDDVLLKLLNGRTISEAIQMNPLPNIQIALASISHMHEMGKKSIAVNLMRQYIQAVYERGDRHDEASLALCKARLGEWLAASNPEYPFIPGLRDEVIANLQQATELDPTNRGIWHTWALTNQRIAQRLGENYDGVEQPIVAAIEGYLNSICTAGDKGEMQDILGFLSLWFTYGSRRDVDAVVNNGIGRVNVASWLGVIPQIIARLYTPQRNIGETVRNVLLAIAKVHPQALLYTLHVNMNAQHVSNAGNSSNGTNIASPTGTGVGAVDDMAERRKASQQILDEIVSSHSDGLRLVSEAKFVTWELIRCAMLWSELWFDHLDTAYAAFERDKNADALFETLAPLHQLLSHPETGCEEFFVQEFGKLLSDGMSYVSEYIATRKSADIAQAWELFRKFYSKVEPQVHSMTSLVMQFVAPKLVEQGRNLMLVVPGMYSDTAVYPRIASFVHTMHVIASKQHPRRIGIVGDDGRTYKFLLKGHEDLRQDERVTQLLGLFNTLIESYPQTRRRDYAVQEYSVTPIGPTAGLVGWVDNCNTLEQLIKEYRATKGLPADREFTVMKEFIDNLKTNIQFMTVLQRVEIFERTQEETDGMDLARSLWMRAPNAEAWLDRRTTYVRTLAAMSMVGHILGLGDRHMSNLMMHIYSGRVVHIDFGDCFEVAQTRQLVPEKVPFRLTRMLVKCMEVSGIDGLYRHSCVAVMEVLRAEKNSMLAMLEAFVSDPLISWRLVDDTNPANNNNNNAKTGGGGAGQQQQQQQQQYQQQGVSQSLFGGNGDIDAASSMRYTNKSTRYRTVTNRAAQSGAHVKRAQKVLGRIREKLDGVEFQASRGCVVEPLSVPDQVQRLIEEATSSENLAQHFLGWCAFW